MKSIVDKILINENINVSDLTRDYIIHFSNRSIRDTINHLEKIYILSDTTYSEITLDETKKICSTISFQQFEDYIQHLKSNNILKAIDFCSLEIPYHLFDEIVEIDAKQSFEVKRHESESFRFDIHE
jgi:DNA polymerase III gamma/tau subunit